MVLSWLFCKCGKNDLRLHCFLFTYITNAPIDHHFSAKPFTTRYIGAFLSFRVSRDRAPTLEVPDLKYLWQAGKHLPNHCVKGHGSTSCWPGCRQDRNCHWYPLPLCSSPRFSLGLTWLLPHTGSGGAIGRTIAHVLADEGAKGTPTPFLLCAVLWCSQVWLQTNTPLGYPSCGMRHVSGRRTTDHSGNRSQTRQRPSFLPSA